MVISPSVYFSSPIFKAQFLKVPFKIALYKCLALTVTVKSSVTLIRNVAVLRSADNLISPLVELALTKTWSGNAVYIISRYEFSCIVVSVNHLLHLLSLGNAIKIGIFVL